MMYVHHHHHQDDTLTLERMCARSSSLTEMSHSQAFITVSLAITLSLSLCVSSVPEYMRA